MMKIFFSIVLIAVFGAFDAFAQEHPVRSPEKKAEVRLKVADKVNYSLLYNGQAIVSESATDLSIKENPAVSVDPTIRRVDLSGRQQTAVSRRILRNKSNKIKK